MNYLVFDLETSGLPSSRNASYEDNVAFDSARIVQIAMILCDSNFDVIDEFCFIVKRENFEIGFASTRIHGISNDISDTSGVMFSDIVPKIRDFLDKAGCICSHNLNFDSSVLKNELFRRRLTDLITIVDQKRSICTMRSTIGVVGLLRSDGTLKLPSLGELYEYCYPTEKFVPKHDAMYDTKTLVKILKKVGSQITPN
jgi:DNA polymerase III epsilon subunit-like protein